MTHPALIDLITEAWTQQRLVKGLSHHIVEQLAESAIATLDEMSLINQESADTQAHVAEALFWADPIDDDGVLRC